jgi:uncharacterized LabA/DUF88 family protein
MERTLVCIDVANLTYHLQKAQWEIDWSKFRNYLADKYGEVMLIYYEGTMSLPHYMGNNPGATYQDFNNAKKEKKNGFKDLKMNGIQVRTKPTSYFYDKKENKGRPKCNFDVEITIDALSKIDEYQRFILCSGDGDFINLIKYLNGKYRKTILIYPIDRTSKRLMKSAKEHFTLGSIKEFVEKI